MAEATQSFGRYRVTGTLGRGAMGEVHAAVDEVLGREVAIKTLIGGASGLAARLLDERFKQEARAIASFVHPHVVQVFDIDLNATPPYLVMERVSGPSLKEQLEERSLSERELRALGIQIGNALTAAHAAGVVHRDVKPANILVAGEGSWKLADFGVAHVPDSSLTMTGQFVGSPAYAPPEALLRGQLGPAGDVYGLGATLYQAAAGTWPRAEGSTGALLGPVPPLSTLVPQLSSQVAEVIDRAVAIEPDQRPTAAELASALARAMTSPAMDAVRMATPLPQIGSAATVFVASTPGSTAYVSSTPGSTAFVASSPGAPAYAVSSVYGSGSLPGVAAPVGLPAPAPARPAWQRWALLGAIVAVILAVAITRQSPSPPSAGGGPLRTPVTPAAASSSAPASDRDRNEDAAEDWSKIVDKVQQREFGEARSRLDEFERRYGESHQTRDLASQLDALPPEELQGYEPERRRGKGRGRGKSKH